MRGGGRGQCEWTTWSGSSRSLPSLITAWRMFTSDPHSHRLHCLPYLPIPLPLPLPLQFPSFIARMALQCIQLPLPPEFWSTIHPRGLPCVLTGLDLGDLSQFSPQALSALPPSLCPLVTVHVCPDPSGRMDFTAKGSSFTYKQMPFLDFVQRLLHSSSSPSASPSQSQRDRYFVSPSERYYLRSLGADPRREAADFFSSFPSLALSSPPSL